MPNIKRRPDGQLAWRVYSSNGLDTETVGDFRTSRAVRARVASLWHTDFTTGLAGAIGEGRFSDSLSLFAAAVALCAERVAIVQLVRPNMFCPVCATSPR